MYVVTNGKTFRVKKEDGNFVTEASGSWIYITYLPKEFSTQEAAEMYIKENTWTKVSHDKTSETS